MTKVTPDIHFKASLYAFALFLSPFADKIVPVLFDDKWPSAQMTMGCVILGTIAAAIGLRAYYDGSYERFRQGQNAPTDQSKLTLSSVVKG